MRFHGLAGLAVGVRIYLVVMLTAIVPPGVCVALVIIGAYLVGQSIEEALNPRLRVANLSPRSWTLRPLVGRGPDAI